MPYGAAATNDAWNSTVFIQKLQRQHEECKNELDLFKEEHRNLKEDINRRKEFTDSLSFTLRLYKKCLSQQYGQDPLQDMPKSYEEYKQWKSSNEFYGGYGELESLMNNAALIRDNFVS